jgi:tetratricopeptide (TPR) repeat protein
MLYLFLLFLFFTPFVFAQSYEQKNCAADTARANELFALGGKLQKASKLDSAALCFEQAAEIWEKACPEVKEERRKRYWEGYLKNKNNWGWIFYLQGKSDFSVTLYLQSVLQQALPWLGEKHPEAANSYNNVGIIYESQGRYAEALQHFQKALAIRLAAFGENNPDVATSYHNIGVVYKQQRRYTEALQHFQKALAIRLAVFGENHPYVARIYKNIGNVYSSQERYTEALQYYQKALAIYLTAFFENHPDVANSYNNVGTIYEFQGRHMEALQYFQRALAIQLAVFGENHPDVAISYNNIGSSYNLQSRYAEALQHFQKALAIQLAVFGESHPDVALSYNNIGEAYRLQGHYAEALQYYQKALESNAPSWKPEKEFDLPPSVSILSPELLLTTLKAQSQTLFNAYFSPEHSSTYSPYLSYALEATRYGANVLAKWGQAMRRESDQIELGNQATELLSTGVACAFLMDSLGFKEQSPLKEAFFFS